MPDMLYTLVDAKTKSLVAEGRTKIAPGTGDTITVDGTRYIVQHMNWSLAGGVMTEAIRRDYRYAPSDIAHVSIMVFKVGESAGG